MKHLQILITLAIFISCQPASKTTPDNTLLAERTYSFPEKFKMANELIFKKEITFENNSKAEIEAVILILDSTNSVIKNIKTKVLKGCSGCEFSSKISSTQTNHGTVDKINTSVVASIGVYIESEEKIFNNKTFVVKSNSKIEEL